MKERILVIRLGALGDLVLCCRAFAALRRAHPDAEMALLTMPPFAGFARLMPWFDRVIVDPRPKALELGKWAQLIRDVRAFAPTRVYDFQGKARQTLLFAALGGPACVEWSGAAPFCSHPRLWPPVAGMHYTDFLRGQLEKAGVAMDDDPALSWLDAPLDKFDLSRPFVLLIPGCSPGRLYKRWPPASYAALAKRFQEKGIAVWAIGTKADADSIDEIRKNAPFVIDMVGKTSLAEVAALARKAVAVVGNDTGPTHLAAAAGAKTVALIHESGNAVWSAPNGPQAHYIHGHPLAELSVDEVLGQPT